MVGPNETFVKGDSWVFDRVYLLQHLSFILALVVVLARLTSGKSKWTNCRFGRWPRVFFLLQTRKERVPDHVHGRTVTAAASATAAVVSDRGRRRRKRDIRRRVPEKRHRQLARPRPAGVQTPDRRRGAHTRRFPDARPVRRHTNVVQATRFQRERTYRPRASARVCHHVCVRLEK